MGVAPHSVRACPADWLEEIGRYAAAKSLPLHVHADEQPREIEECLAEHGVRPIELLARTGCLGPRTTVVHATHADAAELDLLAEHGARVCLCPTTEASLGDGYAPVAALCERGIGICIGSDSNVRIDPLEELRELEGIARRDAGRRNVVPLELTALASARPRARPRSAGRLARDRQRRPRRTRRWPASTQQTCSARSCSAAVPTSSRLDARPPTPPQERGDQYSVPVEVRVLARPCPCIPTPRRSP